MKKKKLDSWFDWNKFEDRKSEEWKKNTFYKIESGQIFFFNSLNFSAILSHLRSDEK